MAKKRHERLLHPMVRDGARGNLRRATWDEALDLAATGLAAARDGRRGTGIFSCSKSTNEVNFAAQKLSRVALGSNNIDSCNRT